MNFLQQDQGHDRKSIHFSYLNNAKIDICWETDKKIEYYRKKKNIKQLMKEKKKKKILKIKIQME